MSDTQTVGQRTLSQKARSNARFLRDNFDDLHGPEADTVASKLEECADHIEKLEKQLAERDAALARCVEALKMLHDETADYIRLNHLGDAHHNQSMKLARDALASLPASAQATAIQQLSNFILTGPDGESLVISSSIETQTDGSFRFTVTSPISSRRFGVVCGITELQKTEAIREEQEGK